MPLNNAELLDAVTVTGGTASQTVFVADLISEGPIQGLVDGEASVYLNDTRIQDIQDSTYESLKEFRTITFSGGTTGAVAAPWEESSTTPNAPTTPGEKWLRIYQTASVSNVTVSVGYNAGGLLTLNLSGPSFAAMQTGTDGTKRVRIKYMNGDKLEDSPVWGTLSGSILTVDMPELINHDFSGELFALYLDEMFPIESITFGGSPTIVTSTAPPSGTYVFAVGPESAISSALYTNGSSPSKYAETSVQFRSGTRHQTPLEQVGGVGSASIAGSLASAELKQVSSSQYPQNGYSTGLSADGTAVTINATGAGNTFGLSGAQVKEVDELRFTITYPSLIKISQNSGNEYETAALYKVALTIGGETYILFGDGHTPGQNPPLLHVAKTSAPISFGHSINLEAFAPYDDFSLEITRLTRHEGVGVKRNGQNTDSKYKAVTTSNVTGVTAIIKEKFSYPFTAYAGVTFSSTEFTNMPTRSFHCKGLQVKVPSNYTTRDEDSGGIASYSGIWDGTFKSNLKYTDNPAWIFYDIVTNNRYGVGQWLDATQIDKYALYRIARYCDELVDDGSGGLEPRFRANLYLTKTSEVYKIIKDMASIFMGMVYWMDGLVSPVIDQPNEPVYSFNKSNVIDGVFNYETSGFKTKVNQVVVSWNNPENNYTLEPLIVEDRDAILEAGRIVSQNAVAFGCTSEGQALRYGRWKLWTAQNQTEIVSFKSALNSGFIRPGDIVNVQDYDRYKASESGRVLSQDSASNAVSVSRIPTDRDVTFAPGYTYQVSVMYTESSVILTQDSATISSTTYSNGDELPFARGYTDAQGSTILDDSGDLVSVAYNKHTRVETTDVTNSSGTYDYITVSPALSAVPEVGGVYAIIETSTASSNNTVSSAKQYKVLAVSETEKNIYSIAAVEHYNVKYDAVDKDYNLGDIPDNEFPPKSKTDPVPGPENVYILQNSIHKMEGEELAIRWDPPTDYRFVAGYEIIHSLEGVENPISVKKWGRGWIFGNVPNGTHTFGVRTVASDGDRSRYVVRTIDIDDPFDANVPRTAGGLARGAFSSSNIYMAHDPIAAPNILRFENPNYEIAPIQSPETTYQSDPGIPASYSISVDFIPVRTVVDPTPLEKFFESYFILYDDSEAQANNNPYKVIWWDFLSLKDLYFWVDYTAGNTTHFEDITGTVSVPKGFNVMNGTGTAFTTELKVGDIVKLSGDALGALGAKVTAVASDTLVFLDRSFDTDVTSFQAQTTIMKLDYEKDAAIAQVWKNIGETAVLMTSFLTVRERLNQPSLATAYFENTAPVQDTPLRIYENDYWFDLSSGTKASEYDQYRWTDGAWVLRPYDPWIAIIFNATSPSIDDGISHFFHQATEPVVTDLMNYGDGDSSFGVGDVWANIADNNEGYLWDGTKWVSTGRSNTGDTTTIISETEPSGGTYIEGDTWLDTSGSSVVNNTYYDGAWRPVGAPVDSGPIFIFATGGASCAGTDDTETLVTNPRVFGWVNNESNEWDVIDPNEVNIWWTSGLTADIRRNGYTSTYWALGNALQLATGRDVYIVAITDATASVWSWIDYDPGSVMEFIDTELQEAWDDHVELGDNGTNPLKIDILFWSHIEPSSFIKETAYYDNLQQFLYVECPGVIKDHTKIYLQEEPIIPLEVDGDGGGGGGDG